jgi:glycosyltransferase involved in cell wall biosynthesis
MRSLLTLARRIPAGIRRRVRDALRGETEQTCFDITNRRELNTVFGPHRIPLPGADPRQAEADITGATRFVLGLLAARPHLRRLFPAAISAGADGSFARWLTGVGAASVGLSPAGAANVRAAFASGPGERAKRICELREDLRHAFPFGTTPHPDRGRFLAWLVANGASEFGVTPEESLWFLYERDEAPDRGLMATYLLRPDWQEAVPHALTPFGWPAFLDFLREKYDLRGRWFQRARLVPPYRPWDDLTLLRRANPEFVTADNEPAANLPRPSVAWRNQLRADLAAGLPATPGANVLGHFRYASGLQEAAFGIVNGLRRAGVRTQLRDLPVIFPCDWRDRERYQGIELFDTTLYVAAVNTFPHLWYPRCGLHMRPGVRRVAVWYWELEELPTEWLDKLGWADEVWAPTRFIAETFRKYLSVPVVPMLPGVELPAFERRPRAHFGLPDDRYLFGFSFDMSSVMARKNPLALIDAFRRAFRPDDSAHLVVKVSRGDNDPDSLARLRAVAGGGITIIDRVMPREEALALLASCDCYVSPHRSEGLGLGMAEAMLMGKPVIATGYSGNLDFMTPDTAHLVEYERVPINDDTCPVSPYPKGCFWAEPSVDHAAHLMRHVFNQPDEARALGERAKAHAEHVLSVETAGRRMAERLRRSA